MVSFLNGQRKHTQSEGLMGYFLEDIPIKNRILHKATFLSFMKKVHKDMLDSFAHQAYSPIDFFIENDFPEILFMNVLMNIHTYQDREVENVAFIEDLEVTPLPFEAMGVDYPIEIHVLPQKEEYFFKFTFAENLFKQKTGESFAENYLKVMEQVMHNWDILLDEIEI